MLSAFGCLLVDMRQDFSRMVLRRADAWDPQEAEAAFQELEIAGRERLRSEGIEDSAIELSRSIDMRYSGQWRSLRVPVTTAVTSMDELLSRFHAQHASVYKYSRDDAPVELYRMSVVALGHTRKANLESRAETGKPAVPLETRAVWWDELAGTELTPVYDRASTPPALCSTGQRWLSSSIRRC